MKNRRIHNISGKMDVLAEQARSKPPWAKLFADDLVLVGEMVAEVEKKIITNYEHSCNITDFYVCNRLII